VRRLDKLLRSKITAMMAARVAAANCGGGYGNDLLGLLLEAWSPEPERQAGSDDDEGTTTTLTTGEVIDECKTFFGAGQETTATLLVWTVFPAQYAPAVAGQGQGGGPPRVPRRRRRRSQLRHPLQTQVGTYVHARSSPATLKMTNKSMHSLLQDDRRACVRACSFTCFCWRR